MNVLDADRTPRVMGLREVLRAWLDHRHEVLVRRSDHRLAAIDRRLEILDGYLLVYLNLDEVIRIIREEDEPKPRADARPSALTDAAGRGDPRTCGCAALRKLEEMEIRREHKSSARSARSSQALLKDEALRWDRIAERDRGRSRKKFGGGRARRAPHRDSAPRPRQSRSTTTPSSSASRSP